MTVVRAAACFATFVLALAVACAPMAGIAAKPCRPGCVDAETALVCDGETAHAVKCPPSSETCAVPSCQEGACGYRPRVGASCGPDGLATCNEGYACLGPRTKLTAMHLHTCALADDGKVWCWGDNAYGELGDETTEASGYPSPVSLSRPAIDVSAGYNHTCAVLDDGTIYCWGNNSDGRSVPTSSVFAVLVPARVEVADQRFTRVSGAADHTCAITEEGTVWCWGSTIEGQCGVDGPLSGLERADPVEIAGVDKVRSIQTGLTHTCVVRNAEPSLLCWGSNRSNDGGVVNGKLGPLASGLDYSATPLATGFPAPVLAVGIGYESTYAVVANGLTYAWGSDEHGQLGTALDVPAGSSPSAVVTDDELQRRLPLHGVSEVMRSDATDECAKMQDLSRGSRYLCWGSDEDGELGFGRAGGNVPFPKAMTVLPDSADNLVRGEEHTCFTAEEAGTVEIECIGRAFVVAIGSRDRVAEQVLPAPVRWDPDLFTKFLDR